MMTLDEIRDDLKRQLKPGRYEHTVSVMYTAASLAMCHGADVQKAVLAGLLHDCSKNMPDEEQIALCERENDPLSEFERSNRLLLHAKSGALTARLRYGVEDEEVLDAIRSHTTGRAGMSLLEKIIYVADYIEPARRTLPGIDEVRYQAFHDLDRCIYMISSHTLDYLLTKNMSVDPRTEETCRYYKEEITR